MPRDKRGPRIKALAKDERAYRGVARNTVAAMRRSLVGALASTSNVDLALERFSMSDDWSITSHRMIDRRINVMTQRHRQRFIKSMSTATRRNVGALIPQQRTDELTSIIRRRNERLMTAVADRTRQRVARDLAALPRQSRSAVQSVVVKNMRRARFEARRIAMNESRTIVSELNQAYSMDLGVREYVWQTVGDSRVRPTHQENNGGTFSYDSPPDTGNPGEAVNCRCSAIPLLPSSLVASRSRGGLSAAAILAAAAALAASQGDDDEDSSDL